MKNTVKVKVEKLSVKSFKPFGQAVIGSDGIPNFKGQFWKSRFPVAKTHLPNGELGWVLSKKPHGEMLVEGMEREPEIEMIWPINTPIIQTVALPGNLKNHAERPKVEDVRAFIVKPGEVIIMYPGTWHYAAFPAGSEEAFYYFMTKDHPREPGWEDVAWVPFSENQAVEVERVV